MSESSAPGFAADLRPASPKIVVALLLALAELLTLGVVPPGRGSQALTAALLLFLLAPVGLALEGWRPLAGRWYAVVVLAVLVQVAYTLLGLPGVLPLLAVPTALAAAVIGLGAALATAAGESVLLAVLARYGAAHVTSVEAAIVLVAIWSILGVMCLVYFPVYQVSRRSWEHFQRGQALMEEARDRAAELRQVLADLAHANRQLVLVNDKLAVARLVAEEAQKAKAAFVANVSHEFRTPLNMIIGLTDLLLETPEVYGPALPPTLLEDLQIVRRNSEHLASMINDVLDLGQAEAGRLALHKERTDLAEVIEKAVAVVRPLLDKKGLELRVSIPHDLTEVYCDRTRIRQVVVNLLSNAARFTERGCIGVEVAQEDQHIVTRVSDTGPGIRPEDTARIFEPFCQAGCGPRNRNGSGLGLSISKQFVELHDGQMWLESEVGVGSTFGFRLPISPPLAHVVRPERWIAEGWAWVERTSRADLPIIPGKPRLVICDGTGELLPLFGRYASEVEMVEARDLAQVAQELARCPAQAVVVNAPLPEGLAAEVERAGLVAGDTPVIGCSLPTRADRTLSAGATSYLSKPVTRADLAKAMQSIGRAVRRVLVVDDDSSTLQLFTRMLQAQDRTLEVIAASTGEEALAALRQMLPDLVVLDILLPDLDGWQVLRVKNQEEALKEIPTIIVSAQDSLERPPRSRTLVATTREGLSVSQVVCSAQILSALLLLPDPQHSPAPR